MENESKNNITITLSGRIDSGNAQSTENEILAQLAGCGNVGVVIDTSNLEYISSAGLRVILRLKKSYHDLKIINVNSEVYEILEMTGFSEMITVEKAYRVVSVEGCEVIGEGANGKVYRIDGDNVVKTYKNADALSEIQHEREVARLALILGVPTAISYDIVRVGDSYGSVFELLSARSFAKILAKEPEHFDWCVHEYVKMLKKIHGIEVPEGKLPHVKIKRLEAVKRVKDTLPDGLGDKLLKMVEDLPDPSRMIHGDYHTKNIVLSGDEVLLIDMDTLSVGHPIFDLISMYNAYVGFSEYDPEVVLKFQGFDQSISKKFWHDSLAAYIGAKDEKQVKEVENKVRCLSYAYLIDRNIRHGLADDPVTALWKSRLLEILPQVDTLDFEASADEDDQNETELDANPENLQKALDFVGSRIAAFKYSSKTRMQIDVAVEEIFVNIAHYAYEHNNGSVKIRVEVSGEPAAAYITFIDRGIPYDPLKKEDPDVTLSAEERSIGGLGIFMAKKTMDEISYEYKNGQNILTMKKIL